MLTVGFVIWMLWKERNHRIFGDKTKKPEEIWKRVINFVKETILAEEWKEEEWKADQNEGQILIKLNLKYEMIYFRKEKRKNKSDQSLE